MASKIKVLIAEDHETVREGLKLIINAQPDMETVGEAGDGNAAVLLSSSIKPDVVVMDISMPGMNGLKATKTIKEICPEVSVIALTRHKEGGYMQELLKAGAAGYVLKQSSSDELIRAIRAVTSGKSYLDPAVTETLVSHLPGKRTAGLKAPNVASLSPREAEVLKLIAAGYSNKEIALQLSISVKTVEAHKANFKKKLDLASRIDIVNYALLQGWLGEQ